MQNLLTTPFELPAPPAELEAAPPAPAELEAAAEPEPAESVPDAPAAVDGDAIEQIRRLGELRDAGLLTPEEFETKKAELLSRL